jgi:hypothetical protein
MGIASATKFIKNILGTLTEEKALITSDGVADAGRIPALNDTGILHASIINAVAASTGAPDSGKIAQLDGSGRIDGSMMPVGIGADTALVTASEALAAGDLVNIWNDGGTAKARKADASVAGKEAHGFVLAAVAGAAWATVYFESTNTQLTGMTPGPQFLSATAAGRTVAVAPSGAGQVVQRVGFATSATEMNFQAGVPIKLAA